MISPMGYPKRLLANDETIDTQLRTHWKALVGPVVALLLVVPLTTFLMARIPDGDKQTAIRVVVLVLGVVALFWLSLLPFLRWWTTVYVLTSHRLILRQGIIARSGRDIPLARINDVSFSHTAVERVLGCGTLVVESAGERGQVTLTDIPRVEQIQRRLYELVEADAEGSNRREGDTGGPGGSEPART
jgi:uncharacterized membrane protein YdbT with pleckstrin-like domain